MFARDILGDDLFFKGLHNYISDWHGRHPMPYDFFNCMNTGSGIDLNWFWKRWFFETGTPDLAIGKFTEDKGRQESRGGNGGRKAYANRFDNHLCGWLISENTSHCSCLGIGK